MKIDVIPVSINQLKETAILFDAYRVYYGQSSDIEAARQFLEERIKLNESEIFIAYCDNTPCGFTQLYPIFSSVTIERSYILNDLFVEEKYRKNGIGKKLLDAAKACAKNKGYKGLALETHPDNPARRLYEKEGWKIDDEFVHYFWKNESK